MSPPLISAFCTPQCGNTPEDYVKHQTPSAEVTPPSFLQNRTTSSPSGDETRLFRPDRTWSQREVYTLRLKHLRFQIQEYVK